MGARALWGEADMGCMWMCGTGMILICCASVSLFLKWGFCLPCGEAMTTNQIMPARGLADNEEIRFFSATACGGTPSCQSGSPSRTRDPKGRGQGGNLVNIHGMNA